MLSLLRIIMGNKARYTFFSSVSAVLYRFGHAPDSLVTLHALLPVVTTEPL